MLFLSLLLCVGFTSVTATSAVVMKDTFNVSLQGLEIAPKVVTNVAYGNSRLSVWGHLDNPNRSPDKQLYFVMPVVMLVPSLTVCKSNVFSGVTSMQFKVIMWDENVAAVVLTHLRQATGNAELSSLQVTTLPMEQIRLTWANSAQRLSSKFRLNTHWRSYAKQDYVLTFEIVVTAAQWCPTAVQQLKERPDSLGSLELQYILHGTRASRKRIAVTGQHLLQSMMYARLQNKADPTTGSVYLNSDDLNELASEAVSKVVASSTTDADYVDSGDTVSLAKLVYDGLATFKQSMATMTPRMWGSTFWKDEFARPDRLTSYLNKVITKDSARNHTVHINEQEVASISNASVNFLYSLFGVGAAGGHGQFAKTHVTENDLKSWLRDNHNEVEWTGEKFEVKSMDLYRLNTQQLNQQQDIAVTYVQVHQTQYIYNVPVSFPGETVERNETQSTFAITKRLDEVEAVINKEISDRNSAIAKEVADRKAADTKEMDERNSATAESQNAIAQLRTAMAARFDVAFDLLPDVEKYQGQLFKVFDNPSHSWNRASDICTSQGGIPATALSRHLMLKIQHIIPRGTAWNPMVFLGLESSGRPTTGWQWVDRGTGNIIDIDRGNTVKPLWLSEQPSIGDPSKDIEMYAAIFNDQNGDYGVNNVARSDPKCLRVLCQFAFPMYDFKPARVGARMTFPHESSVAADTLAACTESCLSSVFCRTFSYSVTSKNCQHHSTGANDPEAVTVSDPKYTIYA